MFWGTDTNDTKKHAGVAKVSVVPMKNFASPNRPSVMNTLNQWINEYRET
jgi:hypothetical protein